MLIFLHSTKVSVCDCVGLHFLQKLAFLLFVISTEPLWRETDWEWSALMILWESTWLMLAQQRVCEQTSLPPFPTHATLLPPSQRLGGNIQSQCVLISVVLAVVCHISVWQWVSLKWVILAQLTAQCSGEDVPAHCADRASSEHRDRHKVETSTCTPAQTKYWGQHNSFYTHIL